ncbi:MAG: dihydrofolate reductase [Bacteroidetes bacterium]|nr:dihydrofolate reductase [Bacteroidota bacterium]
MQISLIAAIAENLAIGKDNQLLWHIRDDLQLFKKITLNHVIIMGRKSFESIGKALPKRTNVVITRNADFKAENVLVFNSLKKAVEHFQHQNEREIFVIGGGEIYRQALPIATKLYLSHVNTSVPDADTFFPEVDFNKWECVSEEAFEQNEGNEFGFVFREYKNVK